MTTQEFWANEARNIADTSAILDTAKKVTNTSRLFEMPKEKINIIDEYSDAQFSFEKFLEVLTKTENILLRNKLTFNKILTSIRGIYYGTDWSVDYSVEKSSVRNAAFQIYTGTTLSPPEDIRIMIGDLYQVLFKCAEVSDGKGIDNKVVDFGHLIIGMDARNHLGGTITIPTQGGTGLEISTWLGDLGGACGMLSIKRVKNPKQNVATVFSGSSFGGRVNLEGDIAAYIVAANKKDLSSPSSLQKNDKENLNSLIRKYLLPTNASEWEKRCYYFSRMIGANITIAGDITEQDLIEWRNTIRNKIVSFGEWYMVNRLRQSENISLETLVEASSHLQGTAYEISTIFTNILIYGVKYPKKQLVVRDNIPPSPKGKPYEKYRKLLKVKDWMEKIKDGW